MLFQKYSPANSTYSNLRRVQQNQDILIVIKPLDIQRFRAMALLWGNVLQDPERPLSHLQSHSQLKEGFCSEPGMALKARGHVTRSSVRLLQNFVFCPSYRMATGSEEGQPTSFRPMSASNASPAISRSGRKGFDFSCLHSYAGNTSEGQPNPVPDQLPTTCPQLGTPVLQASLAQSNPHPVRSAYRLWCSPPP